MKNLVLFSLLISTLLLSSCNKKELEALRAQNTALTADKVKLNETIAKLTLQINALTTERDQLNQSNKDCQAHVKLLNDQIDDLKKQLAFMKEQVTYLKENNNQALNRLQDMSLLSSAQAKSVQQSLENLSAKESYIGKLHDEIARKDSMTLNLVLNLKSSLGDVNDADVNIKVEKNVVFIALSDKMLFKSGQYNVSPQAHVILGKVAAILNARPNLGILVEGNTDNVKIKTNELADNWDLSVKRATSVVRILQSEFGIAPERMTAGGRGEYAPLSGNETAEGRSVNRRTRIIIQPELDQFFKLLEKGK